MTLRTISGPAAADREIADGRRFTIGRSVSCDICLLDGTVSREHAAVTWSGERGILVDLRSSRGTFLNGVRVEANAPTAVGAGDLVTIGPWTFRVHVEGEQTTGVQTVDDTKSAGVSVERLPSTMASDPREGRLQLLIECIASLNAAEDEAALARAAVGAVLKGTGFRRAAMLRADPGDRIEVLAALRRDARSDDAFVFSRSLVREAAKGHVVSLNSGEVRLDGNSVAELGIQAALCLPVDLGGAVTAVIYLDSRRGERSVDPANMSYCEAVARACGLAMAKLKRAELERRQAVLHQELAAAREVQRVLVPAESGRHGCIRYSVRMRPGLFVAGDLFDVFPLANGRIGVFIGDVSGHGLGSALVMAMTQSHLHAQLSMHEDPGRVVEEVNRYVAGHVADGRYVSLWLGVIRPDGELRYVDAGHGHWGIVRADEAGRMHGTGPGAEGGRAAAIPVGIDPTRRFVAQSLRLRAGDRLLLYSDGVSEQRNEHREEFGGGRVLDAAGAADGPEEAVESVMRGMDTFAGGIAPGDDATVACIMLCGDDEPGPRG